MNQPTDTEKAARQGDGGMTLLILVAILAGVSLGVVSPTTAQKFHVGGEIFLRLLKMMVVPLVVTSVMTGVLGMGDVRKLGRPGIVTVAYFLITTLIAVVLGMIITNTMRPGVGTMEDARVHSMDQRRSPEIVKQDVRKRLAEVTGLPESDVAATLTMLAPEKEKSIQVVLSNLALMLFTDNLFKSAVGMDLLPLIFFSLLFAGMLTTMGSRVSALTELISQANDAMMGFVMLIMRVAPLGIFCLVAARFGEAEAQGGLMATVRQMSWYMAAVLLGLTIHTFLILPLIMRMFTRRNPYRFIYQLSQSLLTAFSTASSSATLPVTMECTTITAGVSPKAAEFVLPLGATVNMNGTALYEAAAALFIAQVAAEQGVVPPITMGQQWVIALTATLAAIGAAGIPEAGLVTMLIVLNAVHLPLEYMGLILSVDWLLDRFRTAVNVLGDAMGAAIVETVMPPESAPDRAAGSGS